MAIRRANSILELIGLLAAGLALGWVLAAVTTRFWP